MTEKRFKYVSDYDWWGVIDTTGEIKGEYDNDCFSTYTVVDLLNKLNDECEFLEIENEALEDGATRYAELAHKSLKENEQLKKENKELKSILQDMGLIMSNEEVKNVRDEIASKLIKPLCKENGFDVDVNTENGFTIIPKEVNNAENKRYDVIYEKEPRGQVITDNGIPCTARTCVTRLNRLTEENEQLKTQLYCDDEEGVCNICKHHYLVKDDEMELGYYNSRCQKGHYECARVSLKHCEDFEKELEE